MQKFSKMAQEFVDESYIFIYILYEVLQLEEKCVSEVQLTAKNGM